MIVMLPRNIDGYFISIVDANTGLDVVPEAERVHYFELPFISDGNYNFSTSMELATGTYSMGIQAMLCDTSAETGEKICDPPSGGHYGYGPIQYAFFSVVENAQPGNPLFDPDYNSQFGSYTSDLCDLNLNPFAESTFSVSGCMGYLFIPGENTFSQYASLRTQLETKFPFSYFFSMRDVWLGLRQATSTPAVSYSINLHDMGYGSTTPIGNIIPNINALSTTTIRKYLSDSNYNALMTLASAIIWLLGFAYIWYDIRKITHKV